MKSDEARPIEEKAKGWNFHLLLAFQFLTVLPLTIREKAEERDFGKCTAFFPIVGLAQGLILLIVFKIFTTVFPGSVVDVLILISLTVLTGGLHIDGFCDTVDGFVGRHERQETLRIMKESRVGAFAAAAMALLLLTKYAALTSLPAQYKGGVIVSMPVFALWSTVLLARLHQYPREEGGTGKAFVQNTENRELMVASISALVITLLAMRFYGLLVYLLIFFATLLMGEYSKHRIHGVTGDVLGAVKEVNEALVLLFALAFMSA